MGDVASLPAGLATCVGPVPVEDVDGSVTFALDHGGGFPTVPVPAGVERSLLAQAVAGVPGVRVVGPGRLEVDLATAPLDGDPSLGGVDGPEFDALGAFLDRLTDQPDVPVRLPVPGPVTLAVTLLAAGVPMGPAVVGGGCLALRRAGAALRRVVAARPAAGVAVVLVEPGLTGAMHPTFPLTPQQVRSLLDPVVAELDAAGRPGRLLIGIHVPGRTDWGTVLDAGVSLVSAPAHAGLEGWAAHLGGFLEAGGRVAWGAVPVDRPLGTGERRLWRDLAEAWGELSAAGVDPVLLRERSLVSPVDGLAHFGPSQAGRVMELNAALSERVRRQALAARLPLGA